MYSCLSLNLRLPRARKANWWKTLTSKIQSKLHKPKPLTKTKRSSSSSSSRRQKAAITAALSSSRPHKFFYLKGSRRHRRRMRVYVDKLFKEPPPQPAAAATSSSTVHATAAKLVVVDDHDRDDDHDDHVNVVDRTAGTVPDGGCAAGDAAWEAMGFASPLMRGIDERAEEFIAKFRADMEVQEMLARGL